jgi:acyl-CoA thioesterase-1
MKRTKSSLIFTTTLKSAFARASQRVLISRAIAFIPVLLAAAIELAPRIVNATVPTGPSAVQKSILFIGDSLTEGYGVKKDEAYPEVVGKILREHSYNVRIINGAISGSVSTDADRRLKWFLKLKPDVLVLALGGNDALKGTPVLVIKKNLAAAIELAKTSGIRVLLCGIQIYSNFGPEYGRALEAIYRELANEKKIALMPFLLEGVALKKELNQADLKHPNAKGAEIVGRNVARELEKIL